MRRRARSPASLTASDRCRVRSARTRLAMLVDFQAGVGLVVLLELAVELLDVLEALGQAHVGEDAARGALDLLGQARRALADLDARTSKNARVVGGARSTSFFSSPDQRAGRPR